MNWFHYRPESF